MLVAGKSGPEVSRKSKPFAETHVYQQYPHGSTQAEHSLLHPKPGDRNAFSLERHVTWVDPRRDFSGKDHYTFLYTSVGSADSAVLPGYEVPVPWRTFCGL